MKDRRSFSDYKATVETNLRTANYSEDKIKDIIDKLDNFNNIKYHFPRKGWKYLIDNFAPEIKRNENVYFAKLGDNRSVMCLKESENRYTVVFAFKHPKDNEDHDYKKYLIYKYIMARDISSNFTTGLSTSDIIKYRVYNGIKASSYKNAIVLANNKCLDGCRSIKSYGKLYLMLQFVEDIKYPEIKENDVKNKEFYFKDCYANYSRSREELKEKYELDDKDIRFYFNAYLGILVVRHDNRYHVTFSFVNPSDKYHLDHLKNPGDAKHIYRYCLIKNFLSGHYSYAIDNADNSMSAASQMFNMHRFDFPSYYHDNKLDIVIKTEKDIVC